MTNALERVLADACFGEGADEAMARDLRGFLESRGVPAEDVEAVMQAPPRLAVYRSLVRNGVVGVIVRVLPKTRARLNARGGRFDADVGRFLDAVGPRTHYLRDVPAELLAWAEPLWRGDAGLPPYVSDLARYELAAFAVAASEARRAALEEPALDRAVVFHPSARLLRFAWAVHALATEDPAELPEARDVRLLAYRDADHGVRWLELTPFAWTLVETLVAGETLGAAVARAFSIHGSVPTDEIARLLADLADRGAVLGAAPA